MGRGVSNKEPLKRDSKETLSYEISVVDAVIGQVQRTRYCTPQVWESCRISLPANSKGQSYTGKGSQVWKIHSRKKKMASDAVWGWSAKFSHGWKPVTTKWLGIEGIWARRAFKYHFAQKCWSWGIATNHHLRHHGMVSEKYVWGNTGLQQLEQYYWRCLPSKLFRE